jgi:hypothetical protein
MATLDAGGETPLPRDDDSAHTRSRGVVVGEAALEQALLVLAVAGPAASASQARAAHRRLRFARFLVATGRINEFGELSEHLKPEALRRRTESNCLESQVPAATEG